MTLKEPKESDSIVQATCAKDHQGITKVSWGVSGQTLKFRRHFSNATSNCKENSTNTEQHYLTLPAQNFDLKFPVTSQGGCFI